ncbi:hypothetical protein [Lachnospira intestinalis]|jgi:hypothetical protein|uniref:Helix-turn-helix domain-containing protein n=1 Tax=Lachnospira intestinalis TaxID=3133158 RepID=A0ABV1H579_9FIRM
MAIYRNIQMAFWTDIKVVDDFTPEDKFFYLYLLTNPHTNLCGAYEISVKQMADETGYSRDTVEKLLKRFAEVHKVAYYSQDTKELLVLNWHKYNWTASEKFRKPLLKEINSVKNDNFKGYLLDLFSGTDTVSIPYGYGSDTTVTVTDTVTVSPVDIDSNIINNNCSSAANAPSVAVADELNGRNLVQDNDEPHEQQQIAPENNGADDAGLQYSQKMERQKVKQEAAQLFEKLWGQYPCKRGKAKVSDSAKIKLLKTGADQMQRALSRYLSDLKRESWRKPQNGSTFFTSGYIDYLDSNYAPAPEQPRSRAAGTKFNNFQQRDMDIDSMERQLLSNAM